MLNYNFNKNQEVDSVLYSKQFLEITNRGVNMKKLVALIMLVSVGCCLFAQDWLPLNENDLLDDVITTVEYNYISKLVSKDGGLTDDYVSEIKIERRGKIKDNLLSLELSYKHTIHNLFPGEQGKKEWEEARYSHKLSFGKYEDDFGDVFYAMANMSDGSVEKKSSISETDLLKLQKKLQEEGDALTQYRKKEAEAAYLAKFKPNEFLQKGTMFEGTYFDGKYSFSIEVIEKKDNSFLGYLKYNAGGKKGSYFVQGNIKNDTIVTEAASTVPIMKAYPVKVPFGVTPLFFEGDTERIDDNSISWKGTAVKMSSVTFEGKWTK